jgi:hypothetical protein
LNYDLDKEEDDDLVSLEPFFKLALAHIPSPRFDAVVSLAREFLGCPAQERTHAADAPRAKGGVRHFLGSYTEGLALYLGGQSFEWA